MIGQTLAHYEITGLLGKGGMGEVYRARDTRLGREVALKVLPQEYANDPDRIARLRREAQSVAGLNHPGIVTIHSIDEADGTWFLTMEVVEGRVAYQAGDAPMPVDRFRAVAASLVDALAAAHERGVIHRDLKPANVMVRGDSQVKILDFGLAKLTGDGDAPDLDRASTEIATAPQSVLGTTAYMSPEELQGQAADARSDIFSLGVTLFEIATGQLPFAGESAAERMSAILRDEAPLAHEVRRDFPPEISRIIRACLHKDPAKRPSAVEVKGALALGSAPEPDFASIAVLPFADLSPEHDQDYLCDGLADELLNALTKIQDLKVASRTSCMRFRGTDKDIREIGRELEVDTIVEGSLRKAGQRLRISAQLTKVADGYQLWSERYDRELEDVFEIQEDIARRIVSALAITLSPRERRAIQRIQTTDARAYEYYLKGRQLLHRLDRRSMNFGRDMFEQAIELDPNYALAYCGVVDCSAYLFMLHEPSDEHRKIVDEMSLKALELDPQLPEAHVSRGQSHLVAGNYEEAGREFELAIQLDPKLFDAYYFYGRCAFGAGRVDLAGELFAKAAELRPDDYQTAILQSLIYRAKEEKERAAESYARAIELIRDQLARHPEDVRARYFGGGALVECGEVEEGLEWARRAQELEPNDPHVLYNVACTHARAGKLDDALELLGRAVDNMRDASFYRDWMRSDPDFDPLRGDPRFDVIIERMG